MTRKLHPFRTRRESNPRQSRCRVRGAHGDVAGFFAGTGSSLLGSDAYDPWGNTVSWTGHHIDLGYQGEYTGNADGSSVTPVLMGARWL